MLTSPSFWIWLHSAVHPSRYCTTVEVLKNILCTWNWICLFIKVFDSCRLSISHCNECPWCVLAHIHFFVFPLSHSFFLIYCPPQFFLEPRSRWACPLQSVWDCGTQWFNARRALYCVCESAGSTEEDGTAPQEPVRSGFSSLEQF